VPVWAPGDAPSTFSDPATFSDNIIWQNRQFFFRVETGTPGDPTAPGIWGLCPDIGSTITGLNCPGGNNPVFDDLGVLGTTGELSGTANLLTPAVWTPPGPTDPSALFVEEYFSGNRSSVFQTEITTAIQPPPAFDEGGNFIRARFGPLTLYNDAIPGNGDPGTPFGNYHIISGSAAQNAGLSDTPTTDIDGDSRTGSPDIGADEYTGAVIAPASVASGSSKGNGSKSTEKKRPRREKSRRTR
jgi:hypothetical protein